MACAIIESQPSVLVEFRARNARSFRDEVGFTNESTAMSEKRYVRTDELDASLHPELVQQLVRLFQDPEVNSSHAQLIFNSHDVTLMGDSSEDRLLGRDQIWFTRKLNDGSTHLHRLTEFDPRKQEAVGKRFLDGYYGTRPLLSLGDFESAVQEAMAVT